MSQQELLRAVVQALEAAGVEYMLESVEKQADVA